MLSLLYLAESTNRAADHGWTFAGCIRVPSLVSHILKPWQTILHGSIPLTLRYKNATHLYCYHRAPLLAYRLWLQLIVYISKLYQVTHTHIYIYTYYMYIYIYTCCYMLVCNHWCIMMHSLTRHAASFICVSTMKLQRTCTQSGARRGPTSVAWLPS